MSFMKLPAEYRKKNAQFHILPISYEKDTTYGKGASKGAKAIIDASAHLSYYDEQYECEPFEKGIHTHKKLGLTKKTPEDAIEAIAKAVPKQFTLGIGGDHAVTIGLVRGTEKKEEKFSVLVFDAHSDFYYSWNGSTLNHACVARRVIEKHTVGIVGMRSVDKEIADAISEDDRIHVIKAHAYNEESFRRLLAHLEDNIYVSIDVDSFDPSIIRSTGTPEPGGFTWKEMINMLEIVFSEKNVIGADIVEFAPKKDSEAEAFTLAKLCYKLFALKSLKE